MEIAEIIGKLNAFLIAKSLPIEYQDVAIASTFIQKKGDWLLTRNLKHFTRIPGMEKTAVSPAEFKRGI